MKKICQVIGGIVVSVGIIYLWIVGPIVESSKGNVLPLLVLLGLMEFGIFMAVSNTIKNDYFDDEKFDSIITYFAAGGFGIGIILLGVSLLSKDLEGVGILGGAIMGIGFILAGSVWALGRFKGEEWGHRKVAIMSVVLLLFLVLDIIIFS